MNVQDFFQSHTNNPNPLLDAHIDHDRFIAELFYSHSQICYKCGCVPTIAQSRRMVHHHGTNSIDVDIDQTSYASNGWNGERAIWSGKAFAPSPPTATGSEAYAYQHPRAVARLLLVLGNRQLQTLSVNESLESFPDIPLNAKATANDIRLWL